jgi:hypothetical protein
MWQCPSSSAEVPRVVSIGDGLLTDFSVVRSTQYY